MSYGPENTWILNCHRQGICSPQFKQSRSVKYSISTKSVRDSLFPCNVLLMRYILKIFKHYISSTVYFFVKFEKNRAVEYFFKQKRKSLFCPCNLLLLRYTPKNTWILHCHRQLILFVKFEQNLSVKYFSNQISERMFLLLDPPVVEVRSWQ